jgi:hypothetical protein
VALTTARIWARIFRIAQSAGRFGRAPFLGAAACPAARRHLMTGGKRS